jgi:PST family polysaccharide transporter
MTLAFGYQIAVKMMIKEYFIGEIFFNLSYFLLSVYLMKSNSIEGVLEAYFYTNFVLFFLILFFFRKIFTQNRILIKIGKHQIRF